MSEHQSTRTIVLTLPESPVFREIADNLAAIRDLLLASQSTAHRSDQPISGSPLLTAAEACRYLKRKDVKAFYRAIVVEQIPYLGDGRRKLFRRSELDAWLETKGSRPPSEPANRRRAR